MPNNLIKPQASKYQLYLCQQNKQSKYYYIDATKHDAVKSKVNLIILSPQRGVKRVVNNNSAYMATGRAAVYPMFVFQSALAPKLHN